MTVRMGRKLAELAVAVLGDPLNADWLDAHSRRRDTPGTYPAASAVTVDGDGDRPAATPSRCSSTASPPRSSAPPCG